MDIQLTFDDRKVTANIQRLKAQAPIAIARALNKSIASGRVVMAREISRDLGVAVAPVRDKLKIWEANSERLSTQLSISGQRLPLTEFKATGPEPSRGKGRGISYRMQGQRKRLEHAFFATMKSQHHGVFRRMGSKRLKILELFGPSFPHLFIKFRPLTVARCAEQLRKNLVSEFRFVMSKTA
jgi:hypothetical protein